MTRVERIAYYRRCLLAAAEKSDDHVRECKRQLAKTDLFFLLLFLLKRRDVNRDWLYDRCNEVQASPNGHLDLWSRFHYKALDCRTPMFTANRGWIAHGDLRAFDRIFAPDGRQIRVIANTGPMDGAECFEVRTSDGSLLVASRQHLWSVLQRHKRRISGAATRVVSYSEHVVQTDGLGRHRQILPNMMPLQFAPVDLPIEPYIFGVWLGDGTASSTAITVGFADAEEMETNLRAAGATVSIHKHSNCVTLLLGGGMRGVAGSNQLRTALRFIAALGNKHIPDIYLKASAEQRRSLLQGLMDTDGYCNPQGTALFCNTNKNIAEAVLFLVRSLGARARMALRHIKAQNNYPYYQVTFQAHGLDCFKLKRKAQHAERSYQWRRRLAAVRSVSSRPVNCIQVEGGNYLAGETFVPTHNSSLLTFAKPIQDVIIDPEVTIGIFSHTRPASKAFLRQLKLEMQNNGDLQQLFPDIFWSNPEKDSPKWSEDEGLIVKRKSNPKEATIEAWGLDSLPTGKHFRQRIYDDIIDMKDVRNPDMIRKTTEQWELSLALRAEGGVDRYVGTRYHSNDPYREIINRGAAHPRIYPATKSGEWPGESVLLDQDELMTLRKGMGEFTFSAQMLQNPAADRTMGFKADWLRFYDHGTVSGAGMTKYLLCDPASEKKKESDYTAIGIVGLGADSNYYLLDMVRDRLGLRERGDAIFAMHRHWKPNGVGYERYGMQADIEYLKDRMEREQYRFDITELGGQVAKHDRIRALTPVFEGGRFYLPDVLHKTDYEKRVVDLTNAFVEEEYKPFPVGLHEDMLDMLARIMDENLAIVWPKAPPADERYVRRQTRHRNRSWMAA